MGNRHDMRKLTNSESEKGFIGTGYITTRPQAGA